MAEIGDSIEFRRGFRSEISDGEEEAPLGEWNSLKTSMRSSFEWANLLADVLTVMPSSSCHAVKFTEYSINIHDQIHQRLYSILFSFSWDASISSSSQKLNRYPFANSSKSNVTILRSSSHGVSSSSLREINIHPKLYFIRYVLGQVRT